MYDIYQYLFEIGVGELSIKCQALECSPQFEHMQQ